MFKLIGTKEIIKNIIRLVHSHLEGEINKTTLQKAYRRFLKEKQPHVPKPQNIDIALLWKKEDIAQLLRVFKEESLLDDFKDVFDLCDSSALESPIYRIKNALRGMRGINPSFVDLIELVIHTIFSAPSKLAGGGSTSAAIGCIWVDLRAHWQEQDILEFIVHETTHNLVFIDELCCTHYINYSEILKKENFASSAILNKLRPIDKVFHSIIVSTEILRFREDHLGHPELPCLHPPSPILLVQTLQSIDSVMNNLQIKSLLTDRAKSLLNRCEENLKGIESSQYCAV